MVDKRLEPIPEHFSVQIGDIPAFYENILVEYIIKSTFILPEEEFKNFPLFWEIKCTDDAGEVQLIMVESQPVSDL